MICIAVGLVTSSTAMSIEVVCHLGSKLPDETVISPDLKNPKKQRRQAAHIIELMKVMWFETSTARRRLRISGVMGSRWSLV